MLVPFARPSMQGRYPIGLLRDQVRIENVCKEMMVAIPLALVVQRNDEEVTLLQGLQHPSAILWAVTASDRGAPHLAENRGWNKELRMPLGLRPKTSSARDALTE